MSRSWTPTLPSKRGTTLPPRGAERKRVDARTRPSLTSPPGLPARKKRVAFHKTWWFGAGLGLVVSFLVVAGGFWFGSRMSHRVEVGPAPSAALAPAPASSTTVVLRATPADASLFFDGEPLPDNPARLTRPRDGQPHVVRATAPHRASKDVSLVLDGPTVSVDIALDLDPLASSLPSPPASSAHPNVATRPHGTVAALAASSAPASEPSVRKKPPLDTSDPWQR